MNKPEQLDAIRSYCEKVMHSPSDARPHDEVTRALVAVEEVVANGVHDPLARALLGVVLVRMQIDLEARRAAIATPTLQ